MIILNQGKSQDLTVRKEVSGNVMTHDVGHLICEKPLKGFRRLNFAGEFTRGMMVIDRDGRLGRTEKWSVITRLNKDKLHNAMIRALDQSF